MLNKESNFNSVKRLYHYTSMESAFKILESMTLRFSELKKMNDINESSKSIFHELDSFEEDVECGFVAKDIETEISKYKQISLTMDRGKRMGFNIPAMWAHYAEKGEGVCIVFDQKKLLKRLPSTVEHHKVLYSDEYDNNIIVQGPDASTFLKKYPMELFFTKTMDWSYEQEFRLFSFDNSIQDISIEGCVIAVIMLYAEDVTRGEYVWGSKAYKRLCEKAPNIPILQVTQFLGDISVVDKYNHAVWESDPKDPSKIAAEYDETMCASVIPLHQLKNNTHK